MIAGILSTCRQPRPMRPQPRRRIGNEKDIFAGCATETVAYPLEFCAKVMALLERISMRRAGLLIVFLTLAAGPAWTQQELAPSTDQGPMNIKPVPIKPDKDGVYSAGPGVVIPLVLERAQAVYPTDSAADAIDGECTLSLVIGADGIPADIQVVHTHGAAFDAAAIDAVKQSKFQAGSIDGTPVPVRIYARTRFFDDKRPAFPRLFVRPNPSNGFSQFGQRAPFRSSPEDTAPKVVNSTEAEFSDEARREGIQGVVIISLLVNEEGIPIDLSVTKGLGHGLDEKALEAVSQYRFQPAMRGGIPVEARIAVEVSFHLCSRTQ
jgi:TonB family protein